MRFVGDRLRVIYKMIVLKGRAGGGSETPPALTTTTKVIDMVEATQSVQQTPAPNHGRRRTAERMRIAVRVPTSSPRGSESEDTQAGQG